MTTPLTQFLTNTHALAWLIIVPMAAAFVLMAMPRAWGLAIRLVAISAAGFTFVVSSLMLYDYWTLIRMGTVATNGTGSFGGMWQYAVNWGALSFFDNKISFHLAADGAGVAMCFLTGLTIVAGVFASWTLKERTKEYLALLLLLVGGVFGVFVAVDLFYFFFCYEIAVLPMYMLIGIWGTGKK